MYGSIADQTKKEAYLHLFFLLILKFFYSLHFTNCCVMCFTGAVAVLLLLAVGLLCAYELCAVYVTTGVRASERYSPSGFFFGVSAISLAINMLFICRMVFNGMLFLS